MMGKIKFQTTTIRDDSFPRTAASGDSIQLTEEGVENFNLFVDLLAPPGPSPPPRPLCVLPPALVSLSRRGPSMLPGGGAVEGGAGIQTEVQCVM